MIEDIRKSVDVALSPDEAFELFTNRMTDWWPLDSHSISAMEEKRARRVDVTPKENGEIVETKHDGSKCVWGTITDYSPGKALAFDWYVGRTRDAATQVTLVFTPIEGGTRVDLTHSGFEVLATAAQATHASYLTGWDMVLGQCYLEGSLKVTA